MKRQKLTFLITILISMVGAKAFSYDAQIDGIYYNFSGTEATVTYYDFYASGNKNAYTGNVVIPESVTYDKKSYNVTSIGQRAFQNCTNLNSVTIPSSVTSIYRDNPFQSCTSLTSIVVEEGNCKYDSRNNCNAIIESATNSLIAGCMNTIIPSSVTSIGQYAFYGSGLTSMTIPSSVASIDEYSFGDNKSLHSLTIGNGVTSIGKGAFSGCSGLTSLTIGCGVTNIGDFAFNGCSGLTTLTIPNSVTSIGEYNQEIKGVTNVEIIPVSA
ncbi:MAG: leucine-rich repeat domain-containing protein [Prevotella sp.]|nr:leucine-rich repeat domain-containing protein [Prevotella sp.]